MKHLKNFIKNSYTSFWINRSSWMKQRAQLTVGFEPSTFKQEGRKIESKQTSRSKNQPKMRRAYKTAKD